MVSDLIEAIRAKEHEQEHNQQRQRAELYAILRRRHEGKPGKGDDARALDLVPALGITAQQLSEWDAALSQREELQAIIATRPAAEKAQQEAQAASWTWHEPDAVRLRREAELAKGQAYVHALTVAQNDVLRIQKAEQELARLLGQHQNLFAE